MNILPFVLLGLRPAINGDTVVSAAQIAYDAELRLTADFFASDGSPDREICNQSGFVKCLSAIMGEFGKRTRCHGNSPVYVPASVKSCSYVFVRVKM